MSNQYQSDNDLIQRRSCPKCAELEARAELAEKACAEMRALISDKLAPYWDNSIEYNRCRVCGNLTDEDGHAKDCRYVSAISSYCGKDWSPRSELDNLRASLKDAAKANANWLEGYAKLRAENERLSQLCRSAYSLIIEHHSSTVMARHLITCPVCSAERGDKILNDLHAAYVGQRIAGETIESLRTENERLKAENDRLWKATSVEALDLVNTVSRLTQENERLREALKEIGHSAVANLREMAENALTEKEAK